MPPVRSIGIPVPGAPSETAGFGAIAPWMPADGGAMGQAGQASPERSQKHPFAAELAAAIAAKQGAATNSGSPGNLSNKSSGQNLPRQVGVQREILAKFAEKQPRVLPSSDTVPTRLPKAELSNGQGLDSQSGAYAQALVSSSGSESDGATIEKGTTELLDLQERDSPVGSSLQALVPPSEAHSMGKTAQDGTASVGSSTLLSLSEQSAAKIDLATSGQADQLADGASIKDLGVAPGVALPLGAGASAQAVVSNVASVVSNSAPTVSGVTEPINATTPLTGQSAVGEPELSPTQSGSSSLPGSLPPALEHALRNQFIKSSSNPSVAQGSRQQSLGQGEPQGHTASTAEPTATHSPVLSTTNNASPAVVMSAPTSSGVAGTAVLVPIPTDSAPLRSVVTAAAPSEAATVAASTSTQGAVTVLMPEVGVSRMNASSKVASDAEAAGVSADHTTVGAATVNTVEALSTEVLQSQASSGSPNPNSDLLTSKGLNTPEGSQKTPFPMGQAASSRVSNADASTAAMLRAASASGDGVSSSGVATVDSVNPVIQNPTVSNTANSDGSASGVGRDLALTETLTESTVTVSQARNTSSTTQTGGMVAGQQAASWSATGTYQPVASPAAGAAQRANATPSMDGVVTDNTAQDQSSKRVAADVVAVPSKPNVPVPSSPGGLNVASLNTGAATPANAMVSASAVTKGAQESGISVQGATTSSVALGDVNDSQVTSNGVPSVAVNAGENKASPSSMSLISAPSVLKPSEVQASQKVQERQDIQAAEAARSAEVMQVAPSVATQKLSDQPAAAKTISTQIPAANLSLPTNVDRETSKVVGEMVAPANTSDPLGVPTALSIADRSAQARLASAEAPSIANAVVATPKDEVAAAGNVTSNTASTPSSGAGNSRASNASAAQPSTVVTPDTTMTVAAPDRASISAAEGSTAAQTLAQVAVLTRDSGESKSTPHLPEPEADGLPGTATRGILQAASSSEHFTGAEDKGGGANAEDSGQHHVPAKPVTDFGALVRPVTDPAISSPEGARTLAQRVEAMSIAGPSHAEILARAESRVEAARASLASGPLNVEVLKLTRQGGGRAVLEVTPPNEGPIRLDLKLDGAGRATLLVDGLSEAMKSRLEGSAHFLRQDMAQMGLALNLEMRERQESNAFANAMAFGQGQGGGTGGTERGDPTKVKSGTSLIGGGSTASSTQSMGTGDGIHFVA